MENRLRVWNNGLLVGVITFEKSADIFTFAYDSAWLKQHKAPLSPRLQAKDLESQHSALELRWFLENLLPEGQALDDVIGLHQLSKANLFGLLRVLGKESTGALAFLPDGLNPENIPSVKREISLPELSARIRSRDQMPFSVWDDKVRMSIAGYQDKIAVYREPDGRLFLVEHIHVIDACQALGMPPSYKYERTLGNGPDVQHVRDGVSLSKLFALVDLADNKAAETRKLLSWVTFQYLIGNVDAHGKNISYFVDAEGIWLAPTYDLVAGEVHDCFAHDIGMGIGDEFRYAQVRAFDWAEFACQCGINRKYLARELQRLAMSVAKVLDRIQIAEICVDAEECGYLQNLVGFIRNRTVRLTADAKLIPEVSDELLSLPGRG